MKILMLTSVMWRVGTWYRAFNLAAALAARGHQVTIVKGGLNRWHVERESEEGVDIVSLPRGWGSQFFHRGSRMPLDILARSALPLLHRYDVLHAFTHHLNSLLPALIGAGLRRSMQVIGDRDDLWTDGGLNGGGDRRLSARANLAFEAMTERGMARWLPAMTVVSDDLLDRALQEGATPARIRKIINGCPTDRITPADRTSARQTLGLSATRMIAVFVGVGQYDVDLILDALRILREKRPDLPAPLTILVGPHEDSLRRMAAERGVGESVVATGFLSDSEILPYLRAADIGLLPFADKPLNWARWPIKLGDYLAAGLPVLTNDVGEMGRVVRKYDAGLATASNPQAVAEGWAMMLSSREHLDVWRGQARAAAEQMSWAAVGGELETYYRELGAPS